MLRVQRGEVCLVIYRLVTSFKAEKRKVNVSDVWFWVSPLSPSLCLSLSWSSGLWNVVCLHLICSTVKKFAFYIVFLFWLDQIGFSLLFYHETHWLAKKLLLIIFIFWQISLTFFYVLILCVETHFFHFEETHTTDNIQWMLSWVLVAIIILCVL